MPKIKEIVIVKRGLRDDWVKIMIYGNGDVKMFCLDVIELESLESGKVTWWLDRK